jgi:hypothetical protein
MPCDFRVPKTPVYSDHQSDQQNMSYTPIDAEAEVMLPAFFKNFSDQGVCPILSIYKATPSKRKGSNKTPYGTCDRYKVV